jgi:hypothetical protein
MADDIYELLWSDSAVKVTPSALSIYLILRCDVRLNKSSTAKMLKNDGELTSGMDVHSIAQKLSLPEATVRRSLDELVRFGWLKPRKPVAYQLGVVEDHEAHWYASPEPQKPASESSVVDRIRQVVAERDKQKKSRRPKSRLSNESKRALASEAGLLTRERKSTSVVLDVFKHRYQVKFHEPYPVDVGDGSDESRRSAYRKVYAMLGRFITYCDESTEHACEVIHLLIDEWDKVKLALALEGRPTVNLLGTAAIVRKLKGYLKTGVPDRKAPAERTDSSGLATRADDSYDTSKDVGW